jgi:hypothetical protein
MRWRLIFITNRRLLTLMNSNTETDLYNFVFYGKLSPGSDEKLVKHKLAKILKSNEQTIEKLFQRAPVVVKRNVSREHAQKYCRGFELCGALGQVEIVSREAPGIVSAPSRDTPQQVAEESGEASAPPK